MTLKQIQSYLNENATLEMQTSTKKFVPSADQVYGVKMPIINELASKLKTEGFPLVKILWKSGMYEERILAAKMLNRICKYDSNFSIQLVEEFSNDIDNWALCDTIGMQSLKPINLKYQKEIFALSQKLSISKMMWQRRLSLVLLEDFCKQKELHAEIYKMIQLQKKDVEYYIKKAVVWLEASVRKHQ